MKNRWLDTVEYENVKEYILPAGPDDLPDQYFTSLNSEGQPQAYLTGAPIR